jgi:hypothetical protein
MSAPSRRVVRVADAGKFTGNVHSEVQYIVTFWYSQELRYLVPIAAPDRAADQALWLTKHRF